MNNVIIIHKVMIGLHTVMYAIILGLLFAGLAKHPDMLLISGLVNIVGLAGNSMCLTRAERLLNTQKSRCNLELRRL